MTEDAEPRTITDPEDLPPPAIIPISGISKESREYLEDTGGEDAARG